MELADVARGREVLLFVGHMHMFDALERCEIPNELFDELLWCRGPGGDTDDTGQVIRYLRRKITLIDGRVARDEAMEPDRPDRGEDK